MNVNQEIESHVQLVLANTVLRKAKPTKYRNPRRQVRRDARQYVEEATGRKVGWKAARKWLKRVARSADDTARVVADIESQPRKA